VNLTLPAGVGLPEFAGTQLVAFVLVLGRIGPLFTLAPVLSGSLLSNRVKFIAAAGISLALAPIAAHGRTIPTDPFGFALALAKEVGVGLAFALALGVISAAVSAGASLVDTMVGFSFGALLDPVTGVQNAVLGQVYSLFAVMVFLLTGGDTVMLEGLAASYRVVPIDSFPDMTELAAQIVPLAGQVFVIGLEIAAPVVIALIVTDAAFGLIARAVPQMNVFFVGLPAKILLGFAVIGASLPFVAARISDQLETSVYTALRALNAA